MDDARPIDPEREPWPFLGEVEERLRACIADARAALEAEDAPPAGESAEAKAARRRAQRREDRRRNVELVRLATTDILLRTTEYLAGRIDGWKAGNIDRARDPLAAVPALNRSIIQLTLLEERLDESDEERTERVKEEAAAKAHAEAARQDKESQARRNETRRQVHDAVRAVSLSCLEPDLGYREREFLLGDAFRDFEEDTDNAYDGDPAELAADILTRLAALNAGPMDAIEKVPDILTRRVRLVALAREYLAGLQGPPVLDAEGVAPVALMSPVPAECAQGPP